MSSPSQASARGAQFLTSAGLHGRQHPLPACALECDESELRGRVTHKDYGERTFYPIAAAFSLSG
jgi:hypothetical protein